MAIEAEREGFDKLICQSSGGVSVRGRVRGQEAGDEAVSSREVRLRNEVGGSDEQVTHVDGGR